MTLRKALDAIGNALPVLAVLGLAYLGGEVALRYREFAWGAGVLVVLLGYVWWVEHQHRRALSDWCKRQIGPLDAPDPAVHPHLVFKD